MVHDGAHCAGWDSACDAEVLDGVVLVTHAGDGSLFMLCQHGQCDDPVALEAVHVLGEGGGC